MEKPAEETEKPIGDPDGNKTNNGIFKGTLREEGALFYARYNFANLSTKTLQICQPKHGKSVNVRLNS